MRAVLCFLFALFVLFTTAASAEWVKVAETDLVVVYIDPATIRKDRHLRRVWEVQDYKQTRNDGLMSRRVLDEFDCREEQVRFLSMFNHSEPMGTGPAHLLGNDPFISTYVSRSTPEEIIFNIVCADQPVALQEGGMLRGLSGSVLGCGLELIAAGENLAPTDSSGPLLSVALPEVKRQLSK